MTTWARTDNIIFVKNWHLSQPLKKHYSLQLFMEGEGWIKFIIYIISFKLSKGIIVVRVNSYVQLECMEM